ncbi:MAG: alpha/beta hydrolase-fold protein [Polyangiaceae bacterium]|jgi:predicted esterase
MRSSQFCALGAMCLAACAGAFRRAGQATPHAPPPPAATTAAVLLRTPTTPGPTDSGAGADPVQIALAADGTIGAWLVAGPVDPTRTGDETQLSPRLDAPLDADSDPVRWRLASTQDGALDLATAIDSHGSGKVAYLAGVLHVDHGGRYVLLLGVSDAVTVLVDGRRVFSYDQPRERRDDEDLVALDLSPGDHYLALCLHRAGHGWRVRARLLDPELRPPRAGSWVLPGTVAADARSLVATLGRLSLDRGMEPGQYRPVLRVRYPDGLPTGIPIVAHVRFVRSGAESGAEPLFDTTSGELAPTGSGTLQSLVELPTLAPETVEDGDWTAQVNVAGRKVEFAFRLRRPVREAAARAEQAIQSSRGATWLADGSLDTLEYLRERLVRFVSKGDTDVDAQIADARELNELCVAFEQKRDPYVAARTTQDDDPFVDTPWRTGPMRRAYRSPVDGQWSEFAVYVPADFSPKRSYPLIVALHGMNGRPMEMLMWLFGHDEPDHDGFWEDRHPRRDLERLESIVVAPDGHSNSMYRDLGEDDVMRVVDWALATYPIDPARVTITGPSMGGIGSAACALHHPDRFAAAEPLCGYHSYFVRADMGGRTLHPWERFLAEQRSNVFWAENGRYIPLYVVHGKRDLPEENSGVLIDRYEELKYDVEHEHPDLGHNVWQTTYEDLKGARWLLTHHRPMHPRSIRFKTPSTRWGDDAWVHVRELTSSDAWGEIVAHIDEHNGVSVATHGLSAVGFDRDPVRIDDAAPVTLNIDGDRLTFQAGEPLELFREPEGEASRAVWKVGEATHVGPYKHGRVTGPIHDVFHEPILFVWGASDPEQARANEEVARAWAKVRWGVRVDYPVVSDVEFLARGESIANERALFLVGNAKSNAIVQELEPSLPIRIESDEIVIGSTRVAARDGTPDRSQMGATFIWPNPRRADRYVVVVEGLGPLGTWRSLSLPEMLPDFVVYDGGVTPARGSTVLGAGTLRAGGFFGHDWSSPR